MIASKKLFFSVGEGRVHTFSRSEGFIGLDHGKVPTDKLHRKQLFESWQRWEKVWTMPEFVIRLLTKEQPIQRHKSNRLESHKVKDWTCPQSHLPSPPVLQQGVHAAANFLDQKRGCSQPRYEVGKGCTEAGAVGAMRTL